MNFPFYSTLCSQEVNAATVLTHPTTGEKYGGTDWSNAGKLAEVGAVDLRIENPPEDYVATGWEYVDDTENPGGKLKRPSGTALNMNKLYEEVWDNGILQCVNTTSGSIPVDMKNTNYTCYLEWKSWGGVPKIIITPTLIQRREYEYNKRGAGSDKLIEALWEKVVEGKSESAVALQVIREQVKIDLPR